MKTEQLLQASLLDIVFDGRNKDYGAYELRTHYSNRIGKALGIMLAVVLAACIITITASGKGRSRPRIITMTGPTIIDVKQETPPPVQPDPPKEQEQQVKTEKLTEFKIVDKPDVTPPPSVDDFKDAQVGDEKKGGDPYQGIQTPPDDHLPGDDKGVIDTKPKGDEIVDIVEVEARFNGDWKRFLERNLNPEVPVNNAAPAGRYSVVVKFIVDKEGNVSGMEALTHHGYGMEEEALRVLRKAPKWEPAFQNGVHVKAYRKQVIVFEVPGEE